MYVLERFAIQLPLSLSLSSDAGTEECSGLSPGFSSHSPSPSQDSLSSQTRVEGHVRRTHSEENTHRVATSSSQVGGVCVFVCLCVVYTISCTVMKSGHNF